MSESPYVQQSVDMLKILPQLANGARCVVWTCIGLFDADPLGASKRDILDYTGLSRPTVESALRFLALNEWISFDPSTKRYRCAKYYRYGGSEQVEVRELVPILRGEPVQGCKKVFSKPASSSSGIVQSHLDLKETTTSNAPANILSDCGILTAGLNLNGMTERDAIAIAEYVTTNPDGKRSPAGWVYTLLRANPRWRPPERQMGFATMRRSDFNDAQWKRMLPRNRQQIIADETGNPDAADDPGYGCEASS